MWGCPAARGDQEAPRSDAHGATTWELSVPSPLSSVGRTCESWCEDCVLGWVAPLCRAACHHWRHPPWLPVGLGRPTRGEEERAGAGCGRRGLL